MDAAALLARLLVTSGLVVLIVIARRRTTLADDSLAAGAFLCYVAWALMGWHWLVGPFAILLGYRWLSPPTADNSRRMHGVAAIIAVWAAAVAWLALARLAGNPALLFPYTVVFAAHLAMFGTSRLAFQFRDRPLGGLFWQAVVTSWAIVITPYVLVTGWETGNLLAAAASVVAIALGATLFVRTQADIRITESTPRRWVLQGAGATVASGIAWLFALVAASIAG
jgi:hypothetical protein